MTNHMLSASIGTDLFSMGIPVLEKVIRTAGVYFGLVILLRVGGKRDLAQLNSFDLVVLLLLSNDVQNAVIGNDNSLVGGLLGAAILVTLNAVTVRVARRSSGAVRLFEGTPTTLVEDGRFDERALRHLGMRKAEVMSALRRQGANHLGEVENAVIEAGGVILVRLRPDQEVVKVADLAALEAKMDTVIAALSG
ncbi:MAG: DUF421 domain-containing protein [Acidimicrobiales bacterium]